MTSDTRARLLAGVLSALSMCALSCGVFALLHTKGAWFWQVTGGLAAAGSLVAAVVFFCTMLEGPEEGDEDLVPLEKPEEYDEYDPNDPDQWWRLGRSQEYDED